MAPLRAGCVCWGLLGVPLPCMGCLTRAASCRHSAVPPVSLQEAEGRLEGRLAEFCRKCVALSSAQQQAGDAAEALGSLGLGLALLLHLGAAEPAAWRPLVQAFVRLQAELPEAAEQQAAAAAPSKRGRGAASKKAAAAAAGSGSSAAAASDVLLAGLLQQHAPHLPPGSLAAVVELELQCWAAAGSAGGGAADRASLLAQRLLRDVFPAAQQPAEHAGVLLAMHQLGLPADDGLSGEALLERAASVLSKVGGRRPHTHRVALVVACTGWPASASFGLQADGGCSLVRKP